MGNKRLLGAQKEQQAAAYLESAGFEILERNYRCRTGEIDLIAKEGGYLVFVEVKYRATGAKGLALEAVDRKKAAQVRRVAGIYLYEKRLPEDTPCRFDAVGIDQEAVTHIRDAF